MSAPTASVSFMSSQTSANTAAHETHKQLPRPPLECIALLLEGGGALRAYQAGVYEALSQAHLAPDWVARRTDVNDPGPAKQQSASYPSPSKNCATRPQMFAISPRRSSTSFGIF